MGTHNQHLFHPPASSACRRSEWASLPHTQCSLGTFACIHCCFTFWNVYNVYGNNFSKISQIYFGRGIGIKLLFLSSVSPWGPQQRDATAFSLARHWHHFHFLCFEKQNLILLKIQRSLCIWDVTGAKWWIVLTFLLFHCSFTWPPKWSNDFLKTTGP